MPTVQPEKRLTVKIPPILEQLLLFTTPCLPFKAGMAGLVDTPLLLWGQLGVQLVPDLAQSRQMVVLNGHGLHAWLRKPAAR